MSVYIKGMEMPQNCGQCPFKKLSPTGESMICELTLFTVPWDWKVTDCPLIPVPPHGDLIDRDPFIDFIKTHWDSYDQWFVDQLEARPTIIPADEQFGNSERLNKEDEEQT